MDVKPVMIWRRVIQTLVEQKYNSTDRIIMETIVNQASKIQEKGNLTFIVKLLLLLDGSSCLWPKFEGNNQGWS